jgi:hypothetical protein
MVPRQRGRSAGVASLTVSDRTVRAEGAAKYGRLHIEQARLSPSQVRSMFSCQKAAQLCQAAHDHHHGAAAMVRIQARYGPASRPSALTGPELRDHLPR